MNDMSNVYKVFPKNSYLYNFFREKDIQDKTFKIKDKYGVEHIIPNNVVVEYIGKTSGTEKKRIEDILRKIDFKGGDVNHFLEHLAKGLADSYAGILRASDRVASEILKEMQNKNSFLREFWNIVGEYIAEKLHKYIGELKIKRNDYYDYDIDLIQIVKEIDADDFGRNYWYDFVEMTEEEKKEVNKAIGNWFIWTFEVKINDKHIKNWLKEKHIDSVRGDYDMNLNVRGKIVGDKIKIEIKEEGTDILLKYLYRMDKEELEDKNRDIY